MSRAGPEKAGRTSYGDFINSAGKMRTKTTLFLYKSRLFGQNEQHSEFLGRTGHIINSQNTSEVNSTSNFM